MTIERVKLTETERENANEDLARSKMLSKILQHLHANLVVSQEVTYVRN